MHRKALLDSRGVTPGLTHRLAAIVALAATPFVAYLLALMAWEQGNELWAQASRLSLSAPSSLTLGAVLSPAAATIGALIAGYLTLITIAMLAAPRRSRLRARAASLTPAGWRRLVAIAATGTLSASLAMPAMASVEVSDAGWVTEPTAVTAPAHEPPRTAVAPAATPAPGDTSAPSSTSVSVAATTNVLAGDNAPKEVVVQAGDTLWDIAAQERGLAANDHAAIAAAWPELYEANRDVVGSDPSLIVPDQRLTVPTKWTS